MEQVRFLDRGTGQALEPWTHETLVSPSGEGFQKKIHRWLVWSGQRRDVDELDGISPAKVISECLLSNYNVCQPCANVPITAIIGHRKDYCSILWMEKLRLKWLIKRDVRKTSKIYWTWILPVLSILLHTIFFNNCSNFLNGPKAMNLDYVLVLGVPISVFGLQNDFSKTL